MDDKGNNNPDANTTGDVAGGGSFLGAWVVSAFFSSLERFSCVNISTSNDDDNVISDDRYSRPPDAAKVAV